MRKRNGNDGKYWNPKLPLRTRDILPLIGTNKQYFAKDWNELRFLFCFTVKWLL
jgi:hypothetical protein